MHPPPSFLVSFGTGLSAKFIFDFSLARVEVIRDDDDSRSIVIDPNEQLAEKRVHFYTDDHGELSVLDGEEMTQPLMQPYPPPPVSEKLIDQPIPSEST